MDFEFDPIKSKSNQEKHGINFVDAVLYGAIPICWRFQLEQRMSLDFLLLLRSMASTGQL